MSSKAEKQALKKIREKHELKYDAPFGKRRCKYSESKDCLKVGAEYNKDGDLQWTGHLCRPCRLQRHKLRYREHGGGDKKRGRPPLSESEKKKRAKKRSQTKK